MSKSRSKEQVASYNKAYYEANKEDLLPKIRKRANAWAKANPKRVAQTQRRARATSPDRYKKHQRDYRTKIKTEVFERYGSKCLCCGEARLSFLTIDHRQNDGAQHLKTFTPGGGALYRQVRKEGFPDRYRLLCFNCNCGRHYNEGKCPHVHKTGLPNNQHFRRKVKILDAYGNRCKCCNEEEPRFLCVDHVNNDGSVHRRAVGKSRVYEEVVKRGFPTDFQLLCYNCNCGKKVDGGICPHVKQTTRSGSGPQLVNTDASPTFRFMK